MPRKKNSPGKPCCVPGCDWDCTIPNPACITASACGHTVILDSPTLQQGVTGLCYYFGCAVEELEPEVGPTVDCFYRTLPYEGQIILCDYDPDNNPYDFTAEILTGSYYFTCYREVRICVRVDFDPSSPGKIRFLVTIGVYARVVLNGSYTREIYIPDLDSCPELELSDFTYDRTETGTTTDFLVAEFDWLKSFEQIYDVECDSVLGSYTVDEITDPSVDIVGDYTDTVFESVCPLSYDFGDLSCNDLEAIVTLDNGPCSGGYSPSPFMLSDLGDLSSFNLMESFT